MTGNKIEVEQFDRFTGKPAGYSVTIDLDKRREAGLDLSSEDIRFDYRLAIGEDLTRLGRNVKVSRFLGRGTAAERILTDSELRGLIHDRVRRFEWCGDET